MHNRHEPLSISAAYRHPTYIFRDRSLRWFDGPVRAFISLLAETKMSLQRTPQMEATLLAADAAKTAPRRGLDGGNIAKKPNKMI